MRHGVTLCELMVVLAILAVVTAITLPHLSGLLDWIALDTAARNVTSSIAVARNSAVTHGTRSRAVIAADSLRIDRWVGDSWGPLLRWPGPAAQGVRLDLSNPAVVFDAIGMGWGVSNTKIELRRGDRLATITVSRVGRVKRW
ncbi:MAG TPA: prepilin-type N-terminal cleavage/methylation domain-containing protein [Gemmatimonadales bacterium]|nr:prepilin-type N-terminal cleavage/methylation domain-containing protein [Gemmatimonadales bacterium]